MSIIVSGMGSLQRKAVQLQRFDNIAKDLRESLEALRDDIRKQIAELQQFDQSQSEDLLSLVSDLSQDGFSDSVENPRTEGGGGGEGTSALECLEGLLQLEQSTAADSKPTSAIGDTKQTAPLSSSQDLKASDEVLGTMIQFLSQEESQQVRKHDSQEHQRPSLELPSVSYLKALEDSGDLFHRQHDELWAYLQDMCKGSTVGSPSNPLKTCIRYLMKLISILLHNKNNTQGNTTTRKNVRLSEEWASEDTGHESTFLALRDVLHKQITDQVQSLRQQTVLKENLREDIAVLDKATTYLLAFNMDVIDKMYTKRLHDSESAAKDMQLLTKAVLNLSANIEELSATAQASLTSTDVSSAAKQLPACISVSEEGKAALFQDTREYLNNIDVEQGKAEIRKIGSKLAKAEAAAEYARSVVESDPAAATSEALRYLEELKHQDEFFILTDERVDGLTFKEWLPVIVGRLGSMEPSKRTSEGSRPHKKK